ncbi:MAG TPA: acyl-ACP--UDP-N-acetylglucosamine O-acyltransferase [Pirellulales bacterium]|nr:acyl-ACP--UDP-N-acetylglucosamine O-acyltransferase [Pirellulales bacterium]
MNIHPLAVVSPQAQIGRDVRIGPFAIVEDDVVIGDHCQLAGHVVVKSGSRLGPRNCLCESAVIGGLPQHVRCPEQTGHVVLGEGNTLREYVTVHRALKPETATVLGDGNYLMAGAHVAHDCHIGNQVIMANNCLLAGHITVDDRSFISGAVAVHQFCRIGRMAMIGGHARVVRDIPPFVTVDGQTGDVVGLNLVGLKRNGFSPQQIIVLKAAYRLIFRSGLPWREMQQRLAAEFTDTAAAPMVEFFHGGTRGFAQERRPPRSVTLKLRQDVDELEPPSVPLPTVVNSNPAAPALHLQAKAG